jgi:hypothetical protein
MPRLASGWVRLTDEGPLVPQSQFSTLLLVVGASSGGVVTAAPGRPGEGEHRVDRWAPHQAGQQPTQLDDRERDQHASGHHDGPEPIPAIGKADAGHGQERQRDHRQGDVPVQAGCWRIW